RCSGGPAKRARGSDQGAAMKALTQRRKPEPTIALINIVFLMLIFFLVAGSIAPPLDPTLELVNTSDLDGRAPPDALVLRADGTTLYRGEITDPAAYLAAQETGETVARVVPDRNASAAKLVEVTTALQTAGAASVFVVTEKALKQ
ncbi:MAG: hypothetical protein AAGH17_04360, partial [Pseudomonadota bacterium]